MRFLPGAKFDMSHSQGSQALTERQARINPDLISSNYFDAVGASQTMRKPTAESFLSVGKRLRAAARAWVVVAAAKHAQLRSLVLADRSSARRDTRRHRSSLKRTPRHCRPCQTVPTDWAAAGRLHGFCRRHSLASCNQACSTTLASPNGKRERVPALRSWPPNPMVVPSSFIRPVACFPHSEAYISCDLKIR